MIDVTVKALTKEFGDDAAHTLDEAYAPEKVHGFVPTGNLAIDYVIGKPGIPLGRVTEIAGKPGSGKSSIVASTIGAAQKSGAVCVLVDAEHSYDSSWSKIHGVNPEDLIYMEPPHLEAVFDRTVAAIKKIKEVGSNVPVFIAIDSVLAAPAAAELEMEDSTAGKQNAAHAATIRMSL